jgi:hypothetical protein
MIKWSLILIFHSLALRVQAEKKKELTDISGERTCETVKRKVAALQSIAGTQLAVPHDRSQDFWKAIAELPSDSQPT